MLRSNVVFFHVLAAMALFASLGAEGMALTQIRRATDVAGARPALGGLRAAQRLGALSLAVILLSGLYLATTFWHWKGAWMGLGFLSLILIAALSRLMTARIVGGMRSVIESGGQLATVQQAQHTLRASLAVRLGLLIAVAYLMTVKPG